MFKAHGDLQIRYKSVKPLGDIKFHFKMCASLRSRLSPFVSLSQDIRDVWKIACVSCTDYKGWDLCGENGSKNNFSKVKGKFWGCKMITATGNRMPLLQTASHDTVCECAASLTFFSPLSSFARYEFYSSLNPQILQFSCKGLVSYKLFFFLCMWRFPSQEKQFIFHHCIQARVPPMPL